MPSLSVVVPIYNGEKFLKKCVDSILAQTYTDLEVVLVDDGSTDGSLTICQEYAQKDSRVVVHHKENAGLVAARKSGLEASSGKYIGFVDCDDYIDENMYFDLINIIEKDGSDIAIEGIIFESPNKATCVYNRLAEGFYNRKAIEEKIIPNMLTNSGFFCFGIIPGVVTKVFKREILQKALPYVSNSLKIGEDVAITSYSIINATAISIVRLAAYHYVQVETSIIHKFDSDHFNRVYNLHACLSRINNQDYQKQLGLYISFLIFTLVAKIIKKSNYSVSERNKILKQILNNDLTINSSRTADTSLLSIKDKIKIFLMRHKMIRFLTFFIGA